jgi:hypothetical protein
MINWEKALRRRGGLALLVRVFWSLLVPFGSENDFNAALEEAGTKWQTGILYL